MPGVTPRPAAEFSQFTITASSLCNRRNPPTSPCTASRPGFPTTSPTNKNRMVGRCNTVDPTRRDAKFHGSNALQRIPSRMSLVGKKIGAYAVTGEIGAGGMAVVYKAEQPALDRKVAVKELRGDLSKDPAL